MIASRPRALISTIEPVDGGVPTMTRCIAGMLEACGIEPVFAWYAPWSKHPQLSVPLPAVALGRHPGTISQPAYGEHEGHGLGCWLPELEFTHYLPRRLWREQIDSCALHLSVTGNPLCATPFARLGLPFLAWVATPWEADRADRVAGFGRARRLLDRHLNAPVLRRLERCVLQAPQGRVMALSGYTARALEAIAGRPMDDILRMPVDPLHFHPDPAATVPWRIGFTGRFGDPRKNITLLLEAVRHLLQRKRPVQLHLAGDRDQDSLLPELEALGIADRVQIHPPLAAKELGGLLRSLDLFVIPSHQEGLCIAALEAMACGVPVVSTRCGGPEDYVLTGHTGTLVEADSSAMAAAIEAIAADRELRQRLAEGAQAWVAHHASPPVARAVFQRLLGSTWPELGSKLEALS
ncbi:MAG: glycosyltransferase family 4 protein [Cyanobium sp.]